MRETEEDVKPVKPVDETVEPAVEPAAEPINMKIKHQAQCPTCHRSTNHQNCTYRII